MPNFAITKTTVYDVNEKGDIVPREINDKFPINSNGVRTGQGTLAQQTERRRNDLIGQSQRSYAEAVNLSNNIKINNLQQKYDKQLADITSRENTYNSLAAQIQALTAGGGSVAPQFNQALTQFSSARNYGSSDLGTKLNFQVSDQQIVDDYNNSKLSSLNSVIDRGNTQIAGIQESLNAANTLLEQLPSGDARRVGAGVQIKKLNDDLNSVTKAVTDAQNMQKNFTPIGLNSPEGLKEITSFREFLQLPEERASQQLRQIDPESYQTSIELGKKYREMATAPIGETRSAQAEQLRTNLEQEAINQLALGSQLGAEEQRQYQQAARAAQTARGNVFGVAPAVEEAVTTGLAGEQRKLARYGAATQFLASGQNTSDALKSDLAFRDALLQNRLGAASGFVAGGPSIYNLANQRTAQQQNAMQGYIQANQALPGGFNQQPSTASNFYQTTNPNIPVALTQAFNDLYRSYSNYQASTYGAQVGAQAQIDSAYSTPNYLSAAGGILGKVSPGGIFGGSGGGPIFCWVAREVYGEDNPKWLQFREWMLTKASNNLRNFYTEYGERIAESIRNKPKIKSIIRKWMDSKIG